MTEEQTISPLCELRRSKRCDKGRHGVVSVEIPNDGDDGLSEPKFACKPCAMKEDTYCFTHGTVKKILPTGEVGCLDCATKPKHPGGGIGGLSFDMR